MSTIEGTSWVLQAIPDFELEQTNKPLTLIFSAENKVGGNAGCNHYGGNYSQEGSKITFSKIISTKMACMPGMKTENKFMEVLQNTNEFTLSADHLTLRDSGKILAEFIPQAKD